MKRYLLVLLLVLFYFVGHSQDEQIHYKIEFHAFTGFAYPCNDGDGGYFYYKKSETCNVEFKVTDTKELIIKNKLKTRKSAVISVPPAGGSVLSLLAAGKRVLFRNKKLVTRKKETKTKNKQT